MISFRAARDITWDDVRVLAGVLDAQGKIAHVADPVMLTMKPRADMILEPTFRFTPEEATNLMTALWEAGVRPAGISSPSSEIKRIENHLADMRKLVFKGNDGDHSP